MNERTNDAQFTITRIFDAPRSLVWRAWTESADAAEWWHPRGIEIKDGSVAIDVRPGGRYAYTMVNPEDGAEYPTVGVYREVDPPKRLVFTWASPGDPDDTAPVITVHLRGVAGRPGDEDVYDGWDSAFDLLGEQLAAQVR